MAHGDRSDAELMQLAQDGASPAFAVLLHRHGPAVRACVATDDDPVGAVIGTFVAAMRRLAKRSPDDPVRPWLLELAARQVRDPAPVGDAALPELDPEEADEIWAELDIRWPDGRIRRSVPRWLSRVALVVVLVALAVLVPYVVMTYGNEAPEEDALEELVARPFEDEIEREPADELFDTPDEVEVEEAPPAFEFPDVDDPATDPTPDEAPTDPTSDQVDPAPQVTPDPDPAPTPDPTPEPDPQPDPAPQPDPEPEPDDAPAPEPTTDAPPDDAAEPGGAADAGGVAPPPDDSGENGT